MSQRRVVLTYVAGSILAVDEDGVRYTPNADPAQEARCIGATGGGNSGPPLGLPPGASQEVVFRVRGIPGTRPSSVFAVEFALAQVDVASERPQASRPSLYRFSEVSPPRGLRGIVDFRSGCAQR
jgi:hypothetical protein